LNGIRDSFTSLASKGYHIEFQGDSTQNREPRTENKQTLSAERQAPCYYSNRWLTTIIIKPEENKGLTRDTLRLAFEAENIETRPLWKPMHLQPVFEKYPFFSTQQSAFSTQQSALSSQSEGSSTKNKEQRTKNSLSEQLFNDGLCLPSGSNLTEGEWERIMEVLETVFI